MDDADDAGNPDDLMADAVVRYNAKDKCWVAQIDWSQVQNRSEREIRKASPVLKNGKVRRARKSKAGKTKAPSNASAAQKTAKKA